MQLPVPLQAYHVINIVFKVVKLVKARSDHTVFQSK